MQIAKKGQALTEYGLVLALIAVACISALQILGGGISQKLTDIAGQIGNVQTGSGSSIMSAQLGSGNNFSGMPVAPISINVIPLGSETPTQVSGTILAVKPPDSTATPTASTLSTGSPTSTLAPLNLVPTAGNTLMVQTSASTP